MIISLIREVFAEMKIPFGHGTRAYANLEGETLEDGIVPDPETKLRGWLYPYVILDNITSAKFGLHVGDPTYDCIVDLHRAYDLDKGMTHLAEAQESLEVLSREFILRLSKKEIVTDIFDVRRDPMFHAYDANYHGYGIQFKVVLNAELTQCLQEEV